MANKRFRNANVQYKYRGFTIEKIYYWFINAPDGKRSLDIIDQRGKGILGYAATVGACKRKIDEHIHFVNHLHTGG